MEEIKTSSSELTEGQVFLRVSKLHNGELMIDKYPTGMSVKVNGTKIAVDAEGALNITSALEPFASNMNVIHLGFPPYLTKTYVATVFLVSEKLQGSRDAEGEYFLKMIKTQPPEEMEKRIRSLFTNRGEIGVNQLEVSLKCPFSLKKIVLPCITGKCSHITCFDATSFVCYNSTRPKCPVCGVGCSFRDLLIDGYWSNILKLIPIDCTRVCLRNDGGWEAMGCP